MKNNKEGMNIMHTLQKDYGHSTFEIQEMIDSIYRRTKEEKIPFVSFQSRYSEYTQQCKAENKEYEPFHIWGLQTFEMLVYEHVYKNKEEQATFLKLYELFIKRFGESEQFFQSFTASYESYRNEKREKNELLKPFFVYVIHLCELFGIVLVSEGEGVE